MTWNLGADHRIAYAVNKGFSAHPAGSQEQDDEPGRNQQFPAARGAFWLVCRAKFFCGWHLESFADLLCASPMFEYTIAVSPCTGRNRWIYLI